MNIPKKLALTFHASLNTFLSTNQPVYIHKVFNFALYEQDVNPIRMIAYYQDITLFMPVNNRLITKDTKLITYSARKTVSIC